VAQKSEPIILVGSGNLLLHFRWMAGTPGGARPSPALGRKWGFRSLPSLPNADAIAGDPGREPATTLSWSLPTFTEEDCPCEEEECRAGYSQGRPSSGSRVLAHAV
jgi:hypothetical protein